MATLGVGGPTGEQASRRQEARDSAQPSKRPQPSLNDGCLSRWSMCPLSRKVAGSGISFFSSTPHTCRLLSIDAAREKREQKGKLVKRFG